MTNCADALVATSSAAMARKAIEAFFMGGAPRWKGFSEEYATDQGGIGGGRRHRARAGLYQAGRSRKKWALSRTECTGRNGVRTRFEAAKNAFAPQFDECDSGTPEVAGGGCDRSGASHVCSALASRNNANRRTSSACGRLFAIHEAVGDPSAAPTASVGTHRPTTLPRFAWARAPDGPVPSTTASEVPWAIGSVIPSPS